MSDSDSENPVWPEVVAGGVTPIVGYALGGPVGAVAGGMATPIVERFFNEVRRELFGRGEIVIEGIAEEANTNVEELLLMLSDDDQLKALFARIVLATSSTALEEKLRALGRALGRAIHDDARVDEAFCLIAALDEMEIPHLRLLDRLNTPPHVGESRDPERVRGWTRARILETGPGMDLVGHAILGVLIRHGLVEDVTPPYMMGSPDPQYATSDLGRLCLHLVRKSDRA